MISPVVFTWDGDNMVPLARFVPLCNRQYIVGERYQLAPYAERSRESHRHYFAVIKEAFNQLPDNLAMRFPDDEHLREWALCQTKEYKNVVEIACASAEEARRIAALKKRIADKYIEIGINKNVIVEITAKSQSYKAMGRAAFEDSKQQVIVILADLLKVTPEQLASNAGRAA
jgi:hypothetical protein